MPILLSGAHGSDNGRRHGLARARGSARAGARTEFENSRDTQVHPELPHSAARSRTRVRLLNRTSRRFGPTQAGEEFYRNALSMLRAAEEAESLARRRVTEPSGVIRFTAAVGTAQFALRDILMNFMREYPKISLEEQVTSRQVDLLAENFDVAIRAHSDPLPDSTLVHRTLAKAPWILVAGTDFLKQTGSPKTPQDLKQFPCLSVWRSNTTPEWRLRARAQGSGSEVILPLARRLVTNDMSSLKQAAIEGLGIVALPAYVCRSELRCGKLTRVLPGWLADESTFTALMPARGSPQERRLFCQLRRDMRDVHNPPRNAPAL
jgi:DNA-binding transcriptional LysR family regulator